MTVPQTKAPILSNVVVIRVVLIVLLVFYHAFAIYSGSWAPIEGYPDVPVYWWLDKFSYAFMLESFVFISGYVFGYQVRVKGEQKLKFKTLVFGKFKRLIVPSIIFSLLYILLFNSILQPLPRTVYDLLNGVGHMWFLPMLFWCFIGVWSIEKLHIKPAWSFPLLVVMALFSKGSLPLRTGTAMYYMLFFYIGYIIQRQNLCMNRFYTVKSIIILTIAFCILFPTLTLLKEYAPDVIFNGGGYLLVNQLLTSTLCKACMIIYALCGVMMLFSWVGYFVGEMHSLAPSVVTIGNLCFGVYLMQQFILKALYNYTALPTLCGAYWLPWVAFVVALMLSLLLSWGLQKTRIGKFLIG